ASTHLDAVGSITEVITKGIKFATMMLAITVPSSYCWEIGVVLLPEAGAAVTALKRSACSLATCSRIPRCTASGRRPRWTTSLSREPRRKQGLHLNEDRR